MQHQGQRLTKSRRSYSICAFIVRPIEVLGRHVGTQASDKIAVDGSDQRAFADAPQPLLARVLDGEVPSNSTIYTVSV
jgi:hypothetical protein